MQEKVGLNIKEAAELLGISKQLMSQLSKQKDFPCMRFKRRIVINKQRLLEWFDDKSNYSIRY